MLGVRHAGERHEDAISLLQTVSLPRDVLTAKSKQLSRLLGIKNAAESEERLMREDDARKPQGMLSGSLVGQKNF